jgi:hypothetical protein
VPKAGFRCSTDAKPLFFNPYLEAQAAFSPQTPPELDYGPHFNELHLRAV